MMKKIDINLSTLIPSDMNLEKYREEQKTLSQKFLHYIPENCKIVDHDGSADIEPTYIIYRDPNNCEFKMITPRGKELATLERLEKVGFAKLIQKCTFDNYLTKNQFQKNVKAKALRFIQESQNRTFTILGQSGSGKSHICIAIATELLKQGKDLEYVMWVDEINKVRYRISDLYDPFIRRLKKAEVLYLDDFLKSGTDAKISDFEVKTAFEVINYRYNNSKTTIISSEMSLDELKKVNEALAGRIKEMSKDYFLQLAYEENRNYRLSTF